MDYHIPGDTVLGAVKLKISDLQRSIAFYEETVGLQVKERTATTASLSIEGGEPLVLLEQIPNAVITPPRRRTTGLYHFAILLPNRPSLGQALKRLIASGIAIGQADHLVSEALYISDPDNNGIEIYADRPRSQWKKDANGDYVMASDPIDWEGLLAAAGDLPDQGMPSGTIIGHVHLHTIGLPESRAFYHHLLGFEIVGDYQAMRALFVAAGGYHHHLGLNIWAGIGAPPSAADMTGLDYFTIIYPNGETLAAAVKRLQENGAPVQETDDGYLTTDPSGIRIRLTSNL
ncbi:VOC family protein [Paenibacillus radicis (ex Gao et al. 2016)]|uniref:Catechol-2,3-dioxygenase n=1 Tax=Paenibacillus radicis (ex Gao et al. 2016) TaxID=1737354 RepID=A0A917GSI1_9BACL|nr:VOC family protein [Paenibacillus radicis (ex Gao et al. 2016)]GGG55289.1 catechol-2,3-dioxygenase [Paenibacillus radicis (ex Gao et al. 2016)]